MVRPVRPVFRALWETLSLPSGDDGPVEKCAFARFASTCEVRIRVKNEQKWGRPGVFTKFYKVNARSIESAATPRLR